MRGIHQITTGGDSRQGTWRVWIAASMLVVMWIGLCDGEDDMTIGAVNAAGKYVPPHPLVPSGAPTPHVLGQAQTLLNDPTYLTRVNADEMLIAGRVRLNVATRTISIPAVVNMCQDQVEYLLVSDHGKRYESLCSTPVSPEQMHVACLLLGIAATPFPDSAAHPAQPVSLDIVWMKHGPAQHFAPTDVIWMVGRGNDAHDVGVHPRADGWIYNGSEFTSWGFAAQVEGSFIALIPDGSALMNGVGLTPGDYVPNADILPEVGTDVTFIFTFPDPGAGRSGTGGTAFSTSVGTP